MPWLFILWIHLLAAVTWIGGMVVITLVIVPVLSSLEPSPQRAELLRMIGERLQNLDDFVIVLQHGISEPQNLPNKRILRVSFDLALQGRNCLLIELGSKARQPPVTIQSGEVRAVTPPWSATCTEGTPRASIAPTRQMVASGAASPRAVPRLRSSIAVMG